MLRYSIKRILLALLTVLIIAAITFFAMNAIPGGPFSSEKAIDPATLAALERVTGWISRWASSSSTICATCCTATWVFRSRRAARSAT